MAVKVLVVDDSGFFRRRVSEILSADGQIQVVGTATNGREAIEQALALRPDVITMDYEMPLMDGITAVRNIMQHWTLERSTTCRRISRTSRATRTRSASCSARRS